MPAETSQSLERGLRLLRLLAEASSPMTVTALADALETHRPVVYRLITALSQQGMVHRDSQGRWRLGLGVLHLVQAIHPLLRNAAAPALRRLAEDVGATAHLTILDGGEALAVAVVEPSWTDFHVAYRIGSRHPLERGAAGKAILTGQRPATEAPGYLSTAGELQHGAYGIAAPVRGVADLRASVGVVSLAELAGDAVGTRVVQAAAEVAHALS